LPWGNIGEDDLSYLENSIKSNPNKAENYIKFADIKSALLLDDYSEIINLYLTAITNNPLNSSAWMGLSDAYLEEGDFVKSRNALMRGIDISDHYIARLWESSILAMRLGEEDLAINNIKIVAKYDPDRRVRMFDTAWLLFNDSEMIFNDVVSESLINEYFKYLIDRHKINEAIYVWDKIEKNEIPFDNKVFNYFLSSLLRYKMVSNAFSVWSENTNYVFDDSNSIINGNFENELQDSVIGWSINGGPGFEVTHETYQPLYGDGSMKIVFNGEENIDFRHISQILPVSPNTEYEFSLVMSTNDITTKNGIGWEVYCFDDYKKFANSEFLNGTNQKKALNLRVITPDNCNSIILVLRRYKSYKLDNKLSGSLLVDNVVLKRLN